MKGSDTLKVLASEYRDELREGHSVEEHRVLVNEATEVAKKVLSIALREKSLHGGEGATPRRMGNYFPQSVFQHIVMNLPEAIGSLPEGLLLRNVQVTENVFDDFDRELLEGGRSEEGHTASVNTQF